ncbi:MAG: glycosyltransferase family 39 protein [bacterium]|nr:glycosyltransferase family 39 protein [bacterium]
MEGDDQDTTSDQPLSEGGEQHAGGPSRGCPIASAVGVVRTASSAERARWWLVLLAVAALAYLVLTIHAAWVETPTVDEFAHVPAGCAYWNQGRTDLYCKSPALLRYWMALPIAFDSQVNIPEVTKTSWDWGPWQYGVRFMEVNRARYFELFFRARLMIVLLGLGTGIVLFLWARDLFGGGAAAVVASLYFLSPTVLAHAHLATTDVGCMFSVLLTVYMLRRAYRRRSWWRLIIAGGVLGTALSIKFTALLLLPVVAGLAVVHRWPSGGRSRGRWVLGAAGDVGIVSVAALLTINLCMGFRGSFKPLREYAFSSSFCQSSQTYLPGAMPVPLPEAYVIGFDGQKMDTESGEFGGYLMGRWSQEGWWYYNLVALGVKLPLVTLVIIAIGLAGCLGGRLDARERWTCLLPTAVLFVALSLLSRLNLGIRHVLPVLPFLLLLSGAFWERLLNRKRRRRWLPVGVLTVYGFMAAVTHPNYLSFFNAAAGGASGGQEWLVDSNLDWGQDLYRVGAVARRMKGEEPIQLLYFGHVSPGLYGIRARPLGPGPVEDVIAVSVNYVVGQSYVVIAREGKILHVPRDYARWLGEYEPVERLGSILIYDTRGEQTTAQ